jgi:hypothetical protein
MQDFPFRLEGPDLRKRLWINPAELGFLHTPT